MSTPSQSAERARRRIRDRLDWAAAHGPRPVPRLRVPLSVRVKRRTKALLLGTPVVGPWLFTRLQDLRGWLARRRPAT
ncbi:MAG: hypothetical protein ACRC33_30060 [Gemmataceae bacterium]